MSAVLPERFVIRGANVIDGTGQPALAADVVVERGVLRLVPSGSATGLHPVEAEGLTLAPGFIDAHSHADLEPLLGPGTPEVHRSRLLQGVTTEVSGNCGFSPFPILAGTEDDATAFLAFVFGTGAATFADMEAYARTLTGAGLASNLAPLVGHGTLRVGTLGYEDREATSAEVQQMCQALGAALRAGAFGLSTGLCYTPATYAPPWEVQELAAVVAEADAVYATHVRNETDLVHQAIDEALTVARATGVRLHVSHLKAAGRRNWGTAASLLEVLDAARAEGVDVTADVYPYRAASTVLHSLLPPWLVDAGIEVMLHRLADEAWRQRIARALVEGVPGWQNLGAAAGWDKVTVAAASGRPDREGRSIVDLADVSDTGPVDTIARLLIEHGGRVVVVIEAMDDADVRQLLAWPHTVVGSDGIPLPGKPHPRLTGTFPRVLGPYRDAVGSLPEAVRKMTSATAAKFKIPGRGVVRDGAAADLVVFDPDTVQDRGTFADPWLPPVGIHHVFLGGRPAVWEGEVVETGAGVVLRRV